MAKRRFTPSRDGVDRCSIRVPFRLGRTILQECEAAAKHEGKTLAKFLQSALRVGLQYELERIDEYRAAENEVNSGS